MQEHYWQYIDGNELLRIPAALDALTTKTISMLTTDVKNQKLVGAIRETTEEALNRLNVGASTLAKMSNAIWGILLASDEKAKLFAGDPHYQIVEATNRIYGQGDFAGGSHTYHGGAFE